MKRNTAILALAALVVGGAAAHAATDMSCRLSSGGFVSLGIDADGNQVSYTILTDDLGNLNSAEIRQGNGTVLDLAIRGSFGGASGSTGGGGADLAAIENNPGNFSVRVSGTGGNNSCTLQSAGGSGSGGDLSADLQMLKVNGKRNGRLTARFRNNGPDASIATTITWYASTDGNLSNNDTVLGSKSAPGRNPNKKKKVKLRVDYPDDLSGTTQFIIAVIDGSSNGDPSDDNNENSSNNAVSIP